MKKQKPYKVKYPKQPVWTCFAAFLRLFFKRPRIISLTDVPPPAKAIYLCNHSAMAGPVIYNLYFPTPHSPWGAYPMLGGYKSRFKYLRDVYFMQKRHMNKFFATIISTFEACFSIWIYKGMRVIPSYPDGRLIKTIRKSLDDLNNNRAVMVFPEHSETGYHEVLTGFSAGFVVLAERYYHLYGEDLPIYPVYYHKNKRKMVIGKSKTLQEYRERSLSRQQIADEFCREANSLFDEYVKQAKTDIVNQ